MEFREMLGINNDDGDGDGAAKKTKPKKLSKRELKRLEEANGDDKKRAVVGKLGKKNRLSREVRNLKSGMLGAEEEDIVETPVMPEFTGKMKKRSNIAKRVRPWKPFQYESRDDGKGLTLTHCRPINDPLRSVNSFLKFNKPVDIVQYTDEQYEQHLVSNSWSRQETDHLMSLCVRYACRLVVVHDRWTEDNQTIPNLAERSLEDLKERFFQVQNALANGNSRRYVYDGDRERLRKRQAELLYNRTGHEVWEEYEAQQEWDQRVEPRLQKARVADSRAKQLMQSMESSTSWKQSHHQVVSSSKGDNEAWSPKVSGSGGLQGKKKGSSSQLADGLFAQSGILPQQVDELMHELNVPIRPSVHPKASQLHASVRHLAMIYLDMKKLLDQKQFELQVLQVQTDELEKLEK